MEKWKKIFNKRHDSKLTISLRNYLKVMYGGKTVDFQRVIYKVTPDYENNKLVVTLKLSKD